MIKRHNEVTLGNIMKQTWGNYLKEQLICEDINPSTPALNADLGCRGVWEAHNGSIILCACR